MARYSAGDLCGAGTTARPIISLFGIAGIGGTVREIGITNTTSTACSYMVCRFTAVGTAGAGLVEGKYDEDSPDASCTAFATHTGDATLGDELGYRAILGAAVGSGVIWTFGDKGLVIPPGTANGIGVILSTGTGQACEAYIVWDE